MRRHGALGTASDLGIHDHGCWLYSDPDALMLEGEVDYFSTEALRRVLAAAPRDGSQTVLDLSRLEFIDHHGLLALADHARSFMAAPRGWRFEARLSG